MSSQNLNIILTAFPALTSPVTTNQAQTLWNNVEQIQHLDNRQTLAFDVLSLVYLLAHAGGSSYKANLPQLVTDATAFCGGFPSTFFANLPGDMQDQFNAIIDWNTAYGADTTLTANVNTILTACGFLGETPEATLRSFIIYLNYACSIKGV